MYTKSSTLTLTSGESEFSGEKVRVVAMFSDMRGFSSWSETQPIENVAALMKIQIERVVQICNDHHHSFHKFLGDGFVLVWEPDDQMDAAACLGHALDAAFHLHKKYWHLSRDLGYAIPEGYGVGISVGEAIRIQPGTIIKEMNEVDFVGYPLNCAARMQTLASGYGTVVCSATASMLEQDPQRYLYPTVPAFRRELHAPGRQSLGRASALKGLRTSDRTDFRYLSYAVGQQQLWGTTGMPDS